MGKLSGIDSVSTVKLLQLASEAGQTIYTINSANVSQILPLLNQSQQVRDDIQNVVAAGKEVTIPGSYITRNEWKGTGYMVRNPDTGEGAYMISSGLAGGGSTSSPASSALGLLARQYAALAVGKPANQIALNTGLENWAGFALDEYVTFYVAGMLLARGYIPRFENTFSKTELLNLFNRNDNVILYYSGHGAAPGVNGDALMPGYDANGKPEYVYPQDIHAENARIVFLNSCNSAASGSFALAMGPKVELFMGWSKSIYYFESSYFGFAWWNLMVLGSAASSAAELAELYSGLYTSLSLYPDHPKILITNPLFKL